MRLVTTFLHELTVDEKYFMLEKRDALFNYKSMSDDKIAYSMQLTRDAV